MSVRVGDAVAYEGSGGTGDVLAPFDDPSHASDGWTDTVEPGDSIRLYDDAASHVGETVRVVWTESEGGGQTATLDEREWS